MTFLSSPSGTASSAICFPTTLQTVLQRRKDACMQCVQTWSDRANSPSVLSVVQDCNRPVLNMEQHATSCPALAPNSAADPDLGELVPRTSFDDSGAAIAHEVDCIIVGCVLFGNLAYLGVLFYLPDR